MNFSTVSYLLYIFLPWFHSVGANPLPVSLPEVKESPVPSHDEDSISNKWEGATGLFVRSTRHDSSFENQMVPSASDHTPHRTDYLKERYDRVTQWWHKEKPLGQDERVLEQVKQCFNELQLHVEMAGIARKAGLGDESVKLEKVIDDYTQIIDIDIQIIHNFLDGQKMPLYAEPPNLLPLIQTHSPSTPLTQDEIRREVGGIRMKTRSHTQQWGDSWFAHVWASEALSFSKHKETLPLAQRCLERARQLSDAVLAGKSPDPFPLPRTLWDGSTSTVAPRGRSQIVHLSMPPREKSRTPVPH